MDSGNGRLVGVGQRSVEIGYAPQVSGANTAVTSDYVSLAGWDHVSILLHIGAVSSASFDGDITVTAANDNAGSQTATLATINYRIKLATAAWGAMAQVTDSKLDVVTGGDVGVAADTVVLIEIDSADILALSTTYNMTHVMVTMGGGTSSYTSTTGCLFVLSKGRYLTDPPASAL